MHSFRLHAPQTIAVFVGLALPLLVVGRVALALAAAIACLAIPLVKGDGRRWQDFLQQLRSPLGLTVAAIFIMWIPSILMSSMPERSFETAVRTPLIVGLGVMLWSVLRRNPDLIDLALRTIVLATAISVGAALLAKTMVPEIYWVTHLKGFRSTKIDNEFKEFAALSVFLVPLSIWALSRLSGRWWVIGLAGVAAYLALVWIAYNRAAIAGMAAGVVLCIIVFTSSGQSKKRMLIGLLMLAVITCAVVFWLKTTRGNYGIQRPDWLIPTWLVDFERQTIWSFSLDLFKESPWFGLGINTINFSPGAEAIIPGTARLKMIPGHPHNWFVETLAETGIAGAVPLVGAIIGLVFKLTIHFRRQRNLAALAGLAICGGYWGSGLFNFSFWSAWWQASFILSIVLCLAAISADRIRTDGET